MIHVAATDNGSSVSILVLLVYKSGHEPVRNPKGLLDGFCQIMKKQANFIVRKNNEDVGTQIVHKFHI